MARLKAIVFDMGGVLIDSEELHAHAKRIAFAHAGITLSHTELSSYVSRMGELVTLSSWHATQCAAIACFLGLFACKRNDRKNMMPVVTIKT